MRLATVEQFDASELYDNIKIKLEPVERKPFNLVHQKDKIKFIKKVERIVRSSLEYKEYIKYLRDNIDMRRCTYFKGITNKDGKKISIEIHHEPFTLFDLTQIVMEKQLSKGTDLNPLLVAEEVMELHFRNLVGLLPLSATVHELVHSGKIFIPLQVLYGRYLEFLQKYDEHIPEDIKNILKVKLELSKDTAEMDNSILDTRFMYMEIDGMSLPHLVEEKPKK